MTREPTPPRTFEQFIARYPKLGRAWDQIAEAGADGPLDERTQRLIKLAVAVGALRQGAVHANVRKAIAMRIPREEIEQVVALAAGTLGLPASVAVYSWMQDLWEAQPGSSN
ncbi:MAG: carboxymuconolactone decarboxylase family protein [Gemmatimonadetes bacterium]|nr:carboxymuconolactone decarboxylase family protein [Gemmatimonadota bacterium]